MGIILPSQSVNNMVFSNANASANLGASTSRIGPAFSPGESPTQAALTKS